MSGRAADDVVDIPPVWRAALDDLEAFQPVSGAGAGFCRHRAIGVDAPGLKRPVDAESQPVVAGDIGVDPALGDRVLCASKAGVVRVAERQAIAVEVHCDEGVGLVDHLAVETLEQVAVGREAAFDVEGFQALPLIRGQPVADVRRDRKERPVGLLPEPVEDGEASLGLLSVPLPLGAALGVLGHLGHAGAYGVARTLGNKVGGPSLEDF